MLTKELLKSNVATLTDEQIAIIETLSKNDEDKVIGDKVREIHDRYDADIERVTGKKKPENTKSYVFLGEVLTDLGKQAKAGAKADALKKQIGDLERERDDLQKKLKDGSTDEALKGQISSLEQKLRDKDSELKTVRDTMSSEKKQLEDTLKQQQQRATDLELNHSYDKYLVDNQIKFKAAIPDQLLQETLGHRKSALNSKVTPDWIDNGADGKRLVFRDDKGEIMRNPDNKLEPYTAGELFAKEIADLVDPGQKQPGGGTKPPAGGGRGTPTTLDLSTATNQVDADELIVSHILTNEGIAKTDPKFADRQKELRAENKVAELPIRENEA